jgi:dihydrofolate reductase
MEVTSNSKLILHMLTSFDGLMADPDGMVNPAAQWDLEVHEFYVDLFGAASGLVFGRRLYQQYVGHWRRVADGSIAPETDAELRWAQRVWEMPKHVLSTTLTEADGNTTIIGDDVAGQLTKLKEQADGDLLLMCGPALLAQLTTERLVDEYMLYVCPNVLGRGTHLFRDLPRAVDLTYRRSVPFSKGMNLQIYAPIYP